MVSNAAVSGWLGSVDPRSEPETTYNSLSGRSAKTALSSTFTAGAYDVSIEPLAFRRYSAAGPPALSVALMITLPSVCQAIW